MSGAVRGVREGELPVVRRLGAMTGRGLRGRYGAAMWSRWGIYTTQFMWFEMWSVTLLYSIYYLL